MDNVFELETTAELQLSPAELQLGRKLKSLKYIITTTPINLIVSDIDNVFVLDFPADQDSEILVRESARGTKLENVYKRQKGTVVKETPHTVSLKQRNKQNHIQ